MRIILFTDHSIYNELLPLGVSLEIGITGAVFKFVVTLRDLNMR